MGIPLLGDEVYGGTKSMALSLLRTRTSSSCHSQLMQLVSALERPCLHALTLGFENKSLALIWLCYYFFSKFFFHFWELDALVSCDSVFRSILIFIFRNKKIDFSFPIFQIPLLFSTHNCIVFLKLNFRLLF